MHGIRITEWLNANCSRSFPLVVPGDLPLDLLVDCRLCFFKEQPAAVALYAMSLVGSVASVTMDVAGHLYTVTSTIIGVHDTSNARGCNFTNPSGTTVVDATGHVSV